MYPQENNAIAVVDLETGEITSVHGLGFKDWSQSEIDTSDEDGGKLLVQSSYLTRNHFDQK